MAENSELAIVEQVPSLGVAPRVTAADLVARLETIKGAAKGAMIEDIDYGKIPGTDKPALLKPGAEKLGVLFELDVQLDNEKTFDGDHLTVVSRATVYYAPTGRRLGFGEGVCTTKERKYAYRKAQRACPECGATAIIKGKAQYGGGYVCWGKQGGCGSKFEDGDRRIEHQPLGDVPNPDLPDLWNTVVKMAEKRARVDAILWVTGASALFSQDMEDQAPSEGAAAPASAAAPPSPRTPKPEPPAPLNEDEGLLAADRWQALDSAAPKGEADTIAKRHGVRIGRDILDDAIWRAICDEVGIGDTRAPQDEPMTEEQKALAVERWDKVREAAGSEAGAFEVAGQFGVVVIEDILDEAKWAEVEAFIAKGEKPS